MKKKNLIRHNWKLTEICALFEQPFADLLYQAQTLHRRYFDANKIQTSKILSIKTGACPEDCAYCPQSAHYKTEVAVEKLFSVEKIILYAKQAKDKGATRFCMGAAWRELKNKHLKHLCDIVTAVKKLELETCVTAGMLTEKQAKELKRAGLDYYNHNLDTSAEFYPNIITTRSYQERLDTLNRITKAEIRICCGGILGMGETRKDRAKLLQQLANLPEHPKSVPINKLLPIKGTPLEKQPDLDNFEFIRTIACARIMLPKAFVRISAGRASMSHEMQALCFFAGANAIWLDEKLLTQSANPKINTDQKLFKNLGLTVMTKEDLKYV